jgi:sigma-B regulation protein RsbU (phosphoserine phosphatase)
LTSVRTALELALGELPEAELDSLVEVVNTNFYPGGSIVCYEGEREYIFYIIQEGEVAFTKKMGEGEQFLGLKTRGEFFGELGVLDRAPRAATVHAISDCTLIEIHEETLDDILTRYPSVVRAIMRGITRSVRDTDRITIAELQLKNNELARTLENLKAAQAELLRRERLKRDLEIAAEVHRNILPTAFPEVPGFEFSALARPAREIGGDLYDVVDMGQNQIGIVMADASGKSVQAAIYMAVVRALFLSQSNASLSPAQTAHRIHDLLMRVSTTADMFVTAFYARLDYTARQMSYVRGGHDRPVFYHAADSRVELLDAPGRFLGLLPGLVVEEECCAFEPGDVLVCYSDGVTDAVSKSGEMYGLERLEKIVTEHGHRPAGELLQVIETDIDSFRDGTEQPDDLTLLITKAL